MLGCLGRRVPSESSRHGQQKELSAMLRCNSAFDLSQDVAGPGETLDEGLEKLAIESQLASVRKLLKLHILNLEKLDFGDRND